MCDMCVGCGCVLVDREHGQGLCVLERCDECGGGGGKENDVSLWALSVWVVGEL